MNIELIKLFGVVLNDEPKIDPIKVNNIAIPVGYLVLPEACTQSALDFVYNEEVDINSTFYKTWEDIIHSSRLRLLIDQIAHYASTYGTNFTGEVFTQNDKLRDIPNIEKFKIIRPVSKEELIQKCVDILSSGIALKHSTIEPVTRFLADSGFKDIDLIKNKEAFCLFSELTNTTPKGKFDLLRFMIYKTTGTFMIIKSRNLIYQIENACNTFDFSRLSEKQLADLSTIFYRFKPIFLAFRKQTLLNKKYVNKIRRLAKKNHEPTVQPFWNTVLSERRDVNYIVSHISEPSSFKIVSLLQTCNVKLSEPEDQFYVIRNQKTFLRENYKPQFDSDYLKILKMIFERELVNRVKAKFNNKNIVVKYNPNIHVSIPTSEKNFIGNYPFGTYFDLAKYNYVCCYWKNEWGTRDYDLSLISVDDGTKIGWDADFLNDNISAIYSGDMTNANPEASEVICFTNTCPNGIVKVNQFSGNNKSKFKFLFGQEEIKKLKPNYMVDPNSIIFSSEIEHENQSEITIGVLANNKFILSNMNSGRNIVSAFNNRDSKIKTSILLKMESTPSLESILTLAGATFVKEDYTGTVDLDLTNLNKDDLIKLFS